MAVQNKPERPIHRPAPRPAQNPAAAQQRPSVQKAMAQARPTVNKGILNSARDVFAHKTHKPVHVANAHYSSGPRPQSPLKAITKEVPNASNGELISHSRAVDFLDNFLARSGKIRSKA